MFIPCFRLMHAHRVLGNQIRLVAPPLYVIVTNSLDKTIGIDVLEKAIVRIEEIIRTYGGGMTVKMKVYISALACVIRIKKFICNRIQRQPRAVSTTDDAELQQLMARVENESKQVDGDDDHEEDMTMGAADDIDAPALAPALDDDDDEDD